MSDIERPHNVGVAVEPTDVSPRLIAILAAGLAGFMLVAVIAIRIGAPDALRGAGPEPHPTAAPRLQSDPKGDYAAYRDQQTQLLRSYGWIDRARGIVRLPIEQAMHDVATSGIKDWPEAQR